ncbi:MAG: amidohydrolase, partial [Thermomicrobiales bacterium]|nr:amidohydrolase [Thermomicrobiales bacterium]
MGFLIRPEWMFDSRAGELRRDIVVMTDGQQIIAVEDDRGIPEGQEQIVVEAPGCTLLPGLIDAHVHLCMDARDSPGARPTDTAELAIRGVEGARATLRGGVTTVRCVGTSDNVDLLLRNAVEQR